jgi:hypothetical protein
MCLPPRPRRLQLQRNHFSHSFSSRFQVSPNFEFVDFFPSVECPLPRAPAVVAGGGCIFTVPLESEPSDNVAEAEAAQLHPDATGTRQFCSMHPLRPCQCAAQGPRTRRC